VGASEQDPQIPDPQVRERAGARRYTAAHKARILEEYDRLNKADKGALLRREGLYSSLISSWRTARDHGAEQALARPAGRRLIRGTRRSTRWRGSQPRPLQLIQPARRPAGPFGQQRQLPAVRPDPIPGAGRLARDPQLLGRLSRRDACGE
jgi:hypothetical protein